MVYDVIIIGGWASGLFASIFLPKEMSKLILEKNEKCGAKLLLSWGERCNVTNINLDVDVDYQGKDKKSLPSVFHKFWNQDMIDFLQKHGIETVVEDNGRVLLKSGKAKQLLELLLRLSVANGTEHKNNIQILSIKKNDFFEIKTNDDVYECENLIIATWWKSYPQVGATGFVYDAAKQFDLAYVDPYPCLCGIETVQDMSGITWNSEVVHLQLFQWKKCVYDEKWSLLFTHRGVSGPVVFNASLQIPPNLPFSREGYWSLRVKIVFDMEKVNKKIANFLGLHEKNDFVVLDVKGTRWREEAKVMWGGILMSELKPNFESKKVPHLYVIGEACDIVWRTGGYNLQWAWSSGYVCGSLKKLI